MAFKAAINIEIEYFLPLRDVYYLFIYLCVCLFFKLLFNLKLYHFAFACETESLSITNFKYHPLIGTNMVPWTATKIQFKWYL